MLFVKHVMKTAHTGVFRLILAFVWILKNSTQEMDLLSVTVDTDRVKKGESHHHNKGRL